MMYNEFLKLSGEDYNIVTGEIYMKEIEPVYQCSPEPLFKDKQDFINWWRNNKELCKWMSNVLRMKDKMQKDCQDMLEQKTELEATILDKEIKINGLNQDIEEKDIFIKELERSKEEAIYSLRLSIAFAPDKTMNDLRLYFFPKYEEAKKDAIAQGIING